MGEGVTILIGIDPGLDGAAAALGNALEPVMLLDTPTRTVTGKSGTRREYDATAMAQWLAPFRGVQGDLLALLESVHAMPGQGVRSMFTMGRGLGMWEGLLAGLGIPYQLVTPQRWQKVMLDGMGKGKDASLVVARRLFPTLPLARKKDHGRADALLIAEWGRRALHGAAEASGE